MSESAFTLKSESSCSSESSSVILKEQEASGCIERNLARCVRRRYEAYSQLPVRCQRPSPYYRPPRATAFKLAGLANIARSPIIATAKSSPGSSRCNPVFSTIGSPACKKSLSMIDLSFTQADPENSELRSDSNSMLEHLQGSNDKMRDTTSSESGDRAWLDGIALTDFGEVSSRFSRNPKKAASLVCHVLMLNAWRHRRVDAEHLHDTIEKLTKQVDHLHLQIIVLRKLLDTENIRVNKFVAEVQRTKMQLENTQREKDALRVEKEQKEEEAKRLSEQSEDRLVIAENLRNELLTAQNQLQALDGQISKNHEKLTKLQEEKRLLLDKVSASEALAMERGIRAEKVEAVAEDLQFRLATQITLVESSQEQLQHYSKELKQKEVEKLNLEKRLVAMEESQKALNHRTAFLEAQLAERGAELRRIESAYNSQSSELNDLRERLLQRSQEAGWSSRMLQIAGTVVRAPREILRTLFFSPGSSLPP